MPDGARGPRLAAAGPAQGAPGSGERRFLAFDFGTRRIGVASGNTVTGAAQALATVRAEPAAACFDALGRLIGEWAPDALVVGVPRHPDGTPHDMTRRAERFARQLAGRFRLPVHEVDERYSSAEAESAAGGDIDAESAAVILEQFLRERT